MTTLPDQLPDSNDELQQMLREREVFWLEQVAHWQGQYQALLEQWRLAQHKRFAASSESYPGQGELFNEAEQESDLAVQSDETPEDVTSPASKKTRRPRLPANLPREEVFHDLSEHEKICTCCGHALHQMG